MQNISIEIYLAITALSCFVSVLLFWRLLRAKKMTNEINIQQQVNEKTLQFKDQQLTEKINQQEEDKLIIHNMRLQVNKLTVRARESEIRLQENLQHAQEQKNNEEKFSQQFELLSQRIFKDSSTQFKTLNQESLTGLLSPFRLQLDNFKQQVNDCYMNESKERFNLQSEIKKLAKLNENMQLEAANLTNALKGDNKQQGTWGEVVLQRILDSSGLRDGHEYQTQGHYKDENGKRFLPDVIVHLPQNKDVIIDSKVSLVAYERYFNAESLEDQKSAIQAHALSVRQHIKGLGKKNYQNLIGTNTLDYVLLFVAVEPAFIAAIEYDPDLVKLALDNNILLASPTNLMIALRTIENIWRFEKQEQNGQQIAKQASKLYDKLRLFTDNMLDVGNQLGKAQGSYDHAIKQLSQGRGNVIAQVESLKNMGVTVTKPLNAALVEQSKFVSSNEQLQANTTVVD